VAEPDDLEVALASALDEQWPGIGDGLERRPSRSSLGSPLFYLHWSDGPSIREVREFLDRSAFSGVSVMFDRQWPAP
jgi:hypothetical protein